MIWQPEQYSKFLSERTQPAVDLISRLWVEEPKSIIDIGCGVGNSTAQLKARYPEAEILGVDNSPEMLEAARKNYPDIEFRHCDVSKELEGMTEKFDIVFSNACIQWIPNHYILLLDMMGLLNEGGELAVQVPLSAEAPMQKILTEMLEEPQWQDKLPKKRQRYALRPDEYYDLLGQLSSDFFMWETVYYHRMKSRGDIVEWYKSTALRPYLEALSEEEGKVFEAEVYERIKEAYPKRKNGEVIFRFPRLFFIATK